MACSPPIPTSASWLNADIAQAERHITFVQERIGRQRRITDELAQTGREIDCAVSMLHALESCLRALEQHRETILERCEA